MAVPHALNDTSLRVQSGRSSPIRTGMHSGLSCLSVRAASIGCRTSSPRSFQGLASERQLEWSRRRRCNCEGGSHVEPPRHAGPSAISLVICSSSAVADDVPPLRVDVPWSPSTGPHLVTSRLTDRSAPAAVGFRSSPDRSAGPAADTSLRIAAASLARAGIARRRLSTGSACFQLWTLLRADRPSQYTAARAPLPHDYSPRFATALAGSRKPTEERLPRKRSGGTSTGRSTAPFKGPSLY